MNGRTIEKMQYFVGKVCSIVTSSMNRSFDEKISREHFVNRIEEVGIDGVWGTHPYNSEIISFFSMNHIISIHEEFELDLKNPEHREMIEEYEKKTGTKISPDIGNINDDPLKVIEEDDTQIEKPSQNDSDGLTFVDIQSLEKLAEFSSKQFAAQDLLGQ